MRNLDTTVVAPQGEGKSTLALNILKDLGVASERIARFYIHEGAEVSASGITEYLRLHGADAAIIDIHLAADLKTVAEAVQQYRNITHRKVAVVYCIQASQIDFLNYKHL